jgi:hypothetical protein
MKRPNADWSYRSPLKPSELQVLLAQYSKEGEFVGVQTKFNYAWVRHIIQRYLQETMGRRVVADMTTKTLRD